MQANVPVLAWGLPGVGKTSYINAFAQALSVPCETVILSLREPADVAGLPVLQPDGTVAINPPDWAVRLKQAGKGILFFDELTTATPSTQAAALRIVHERIAGSLQLPDQVMIIAAANPPEYAAGGWDLTAPLANRFCHIDWALDTEAWIDGITSGFPAPNVKKLSDNWRSQLPKARSLVTSFINSRRTALMRFPKNDSEAGKAWPSPRSWDEASKLIAACLDIYGSVTDITGINETAMRLVSGCVGSGPAQEFFTYIKNLDLPDPEILLMNPDSLNMDEYERHDRLFALLQSVVSAILEKNTSNRWLAGWFILEKVVDAGIEDIAARSAHMLAKNKPDDATIPPQISAFVPILRESGLLK